MPTIMTVQGSIPVLFFFFFKIHFLNISIMVQTITDLFFTVWKLWPEWMKGAVGQDGQVTILDLQKHMAYFIWKFLLSEPSNYNSPSSIDDGNFSNLTLCESGWQGNIIPMAWSTVWAHNSEQILRKPNRSVWHISKL